MARPDLSAPPRVVFAAPAYNGGRHAEPALRSLLAQREPRLRVVVVDDASTDGTAGIARALAAADGRIRVVVNERRLGMLENTRRAWALAREAWPEAEFVALASDHDVWDPDWLGSLLAALEGRPQAVLAYPLSERVDGDGRPVPGVRTWRCETSGEADPYRRLRRAYRCMVAGDMIYGLVRAGALDRVGGYRAVLVPDRLLLSELALAGEFVQVPRVLWRRRFAGLARLDRQRQAFWPGGAPARAHVPWWLAHAGLVAWERAVLGRGGRRAGARLALELLAAGARLRAVRRAQAARRRLGRRLEGPARAALRRSPGLRNAVAERRLPVPADTADVLLRLLAEAPATPPAPRTARLRWAPMEKTTTIRKSLDRARELAAAAQALPGAPAEFRRLNEENKRLRWELKRRPTRAEAPPVRELSSDDAAAVKAFHLLFRDSDVHRPYKQTYWRGHRVIKCPLDLWVYQELIHELRPDLIIETGTMYGGSAFFLASIMDLEGTGEVLTIDRNHREGRPEHPRVSYLTGSSSDPAIVAQAAERAAGKQTVMVVLDSNHKAFHVIDELRAYHELVTPGSYLVVEDTNINGHPVEPDFGPGPMEALEEFLAENDDFEIDASREKYLLTFNPRGWLRKKAAA